LDNEGFFPVEINGGQIKAVNWLDVHRKVIHMQLVDPDTGKE